MAEYNPHNFIGFRTSTKTKYSVFLFFTPAGYKILVNYKPFSEEYSIEKSEGLKNYSTSEFISWARESGLVDVPKCRIYSFGGIAKLPVTDSVTRALCDLATFTSEFLSKNEHIILRNSDKKLVEEYSKKSDCESELGEVNPEKKSLKMTRCEESLGDLHDTLELLSTLQKTIKQRYISQYKETWEAEAKEAYFSSEKLKSLEKETVAKFLNEEKMKDLEREIKTNPENLRKWREEALNGYLTKEVKEKCCENYTSSRAPTWRNEFIAANCHLWTEEEIEKRLGERIISMFPMVKNYTTREKTSKPAEEAQAAVLLTNTRTPMSIPTILPVPDNTRVVATKSTNGNIPPKPSRGFETSVPETRKN